MNKQKCIYYICTTNDKLDESLLTFSENVCTFAVVTTRLLVMVQYCVNRVMRVEKSYSFSWFRYRLDKLFNTWLMLFNKYKF